MATTLLGVCLNLSICLPVVPERTSPQTIFTMRAGVNNRLSSGMVALAEFTVFALPFSVVQYVPKFFFGGLLLWFGLEIVSGDRAYRTWVLLVWVKVARGGRAYAEGT